MPTKTLTGISKGKISTRANMSAQSKKTIPNAPTGKIFFLKCSPYLKDTRFGITMPVNGIFPTVNKTLAEPRATKIIPIKRNVV